MKNLASRLIGSGIIAASCFFSGCEQDSYEWEGDTISAKIADGPMHTYQWNEVHVSVRGDTLYDVIIEGSNDGGVDTIAFSKCYNASPVGRGRVVYNSEPNNPQQYSPTLRIRSGNTGKIDSPGETYGFTTVSFVISMQSTDAGGFWPKKLILTKVQE